MTNIEFLENLVEEYKKEFEENPFKNAGINAFRDGMIFAWKLAILKLKNGDLNDCD